MRGSIVLLLLCAALTASSAARAACPIRPSWPTGGFPRRTDEPVRLFPERVRALEEYMFTLRGEDEDRHGIRTDALVVVHQGAIFYERYARGYDRDTPHLAWSVSKTITNMLTGIAVANGLLRIDDSVCMHLRNAPADRCDLTVKHLLEFASGFDWTEDYEGSKSRQDSSVIAMLYGEGRNDMAGFVLRQPRSDLPGTAWRYSTGDSTLLAAVVDAAMRPHAGADYPWTLLFDPLGVRGMTMELDGAGNHVGGAYSFAPAEDWAHLGFLLLNDGCWNDVRLLPEGWVADSTKPSEPFLRKRYEELLDEEQGRQIWINRTSAVRNPRPWPFVPEDAFMAIGHWGQYIVVVPSRDMVIVRSGDDREDRALDLNRFIELAMALTGDDG